MNICNNTLSAHLSCLFSVSCTPVKPCVISFPQSVSLHTTRSLAIILHIPSFSTWPIIHYKFRSTNISIITFLIYILLLRLGNCTPIHSIMKLVTKSQTVHNNGIYNMPCAYLWMLTFLFIPLSHNCRILYSTLNSLLFSRI